MRVLLFLAGVASCAAGPMIWPQPQQYQNGSDVLLVNGKAFRFQATKPSSDLTAAFGRYTEQTFPHRPMVTTGIEGATVTVTNPTADLQLGVDESYTLSVTSSEIKITAATQFGAYHAMETLSQLIVFNFDTQGYEVRNGPWDITDKPRFPHREILIDTARHFQPIASIKHIITSLTYAKVNTLHWHIVDTQSFPYDSPSFPLLARKGAFSNYERYSQNDVQDIVEYARQRGVRVVMEVDTPGHARSWCKGHPEICPAWDCPGPLSPATNKTFEIIEAVWKDLKQVTIDSHFHIGGDEVRTECWEVTENVRQWMIDNHFTPNDALGYFSGRVSDSVFAMGRSATAWEELWDRLGTKLDKRTIIQQWKRHSTIAKKAIEAGYRVIWSTDGDWYLDGLKVTWQHMYEQEPCEDIPTAACDQLMLGGGGEMWGETVDTSDIQQTVWPRLAAVAERLWSPRTVTDVTAAAPRITYFRCLLNRRGIGAAPVNNAHARQPPPGPGSCFDQ